jgi:hypothetical protein
MCEWYADGNSRKEIVFEGVEKSLSIASFNTGASVYVAKQTQITR